MRDQKTDKLISEILDQNGIFLEEDMTMNLDMDSLTFISIIVGIESTFNIDIPEKFLIKKPVTYNDFYEFIYMILEDPETIKVN